MDKLAYLEELAERVKTGKIRTSEKPEDGAALLQDVCRIVTKELCNEIVDDITDPLTVHFEPGFPSWKHYMVYVNGYKDYEQVLQRMFTEKELDILWHNSHINDHLSEEQIKEQLIRQIGKLKMFTLVTQTIAGNPEQNRQSQMAIKATIKGLYNRLYE